MKGILSKIMIFLGVFSLVMGTLGVFGIDSSYAENLELIGRDVGLVIEPSSTKLFNLSNMNPGDTQEAKIDIKNQYTLPFQLFMRAERMSPFPEDEVDLLEQLQITVNIDGIEIYSGPMINFATNNIDLGRFNINADVELNATVHLPGPGTGNDFQGKSVDVKWIFIAESDTPPTPEPPGPPGPEPPFVPPIIITPITPTPPIAPEEPPAEPEVPEEEEVIDEEVPEGVPDIEPEEPPMEPEGPEEEEIIDETIPQDRPRMPRTGEASPMLYYGLGTILIGLGVGTGRKRKK